MLLLLFFFYPCSCFIFLFMSLCIFISFCHHHYYCYVSHPFSSLSYLHSPLVLLFILFSSVSLLLPPPPFHTLLILLDLTKCLLVICSKLRVRNHSYCLTVVSYFHFLPVSLVPLLFFLHLSLTIHPPPASTLPSPAALHHPATTTITPTPPLHHQLPLHFLKFSLLYHLPDHIHHLHLASITWLPTTCQLSPPPARPLTSTTSFPFAHHSSSHISFVPSLHPQLFLPLLFS